MFGTLVQISVAISKKVKSNYLRPSLARKTENDQVELEVNFYSSTDLSSDFRDSKK